MNTSPAKETLIAENISVHFGGLAAIENVSLTLKSGEIAGLIGPNGAGKTTLVNCLTGFQTPTTGKIVVGDVDFTAHSAQKYRKSGVARTFQAGRLFGELSVLENVEASCLALGLSTRQARENSLELLSWFGISNKRFLPAKALAYTDQRRLSIARALAVAPKFLLLDEPAAGMSDNEAEELISHMLEVRDKFGCGVLLIEHNMHVVMSVSDHIHVLDGGRKIAEGTPEEIKKNPDVMAAYLGEEA